MSYPFEHGNDTLWDAGYQTGQLYASLAWGAADFLGLPSGLTPNRPHGSCDVEPEAFQAFAEALYTRYCATNNQVTHNLMHGLLITSLVLLERAGGGVTLRPEHEEAFTAEKAALARSMATL